MPPEIQKLTGRFLRDPVKVEVARQNSTADTIVQKLLKAGGKPADKRAALRDSIRGEADLTNAIIFCNRKRDVATLARSLERHGFNAGALHGDMDQKSRMDTLDQFKKGTLKFLIASDVAARGLDIPAVSHVFNFDVPTHAEDYVHRIGRTGRAGRKGHSITLVTPADNKHIDAIMKLIQRDIEWVGATAVSGKSAPAAQPDNKRDSAPRKSAKEGQSVSPERVGTPTQQKPSNSRAKSGGKSEKKSDSPFGSDGPVPAFLLRSAVKAD
jgi:superfamily II DNA/RNA helicase